jgi:hypothetical protein
LNHAIEISKNFTRAHSKRPHALPGKPPIPSGIVAGAKIVAHLIDFHAELHAVAVKIENVGSGGMLMPKAQAGLFPAQSSPKQSLRQ